MATKNEIQRKQRKIKVLNVAKRLFLEQGYEGTSIQQIANGSNIAKGAVYLCFASKEQILQEVIIQALISLQEDFSQDDKDNYFLRFLPLQLHSKRVSDTLSDLIHNLGKEKALKILAELVFDPETKIQKY